MKKLMVAGVAAALLTASSFAAYADQATGSITSIDVTAGTITLDDGKTYVLPAAVADVSTYKAGDKVTLTYDDTNGTLTISKVDVSAS